MREKCCVDQKRGRGDNQTFQCTISGTPYNCRCCRALRNVGVQLTAGVINKNEQTADSFPLFEPAMVGDPSTWIRETFLSSTDGVFRAPDTGRNPDNAQEDGRGSDRRFFSRAPVVQTSRIARPFDTSMDVRPLTTPAGLELSTRQQDSKVRFYRFVESSIDLDVRCVLLHGTYLPKGPDKFRPAGEASSISNLEKRLTWSLRLQSRRTIIYIM